MEIPHIVEGRVVPDSIRKKTGFWKRQFAPVVTRPQVTFDIIFGVIGPILCFVLDPLVFRNGFAGPPLFPDYQTFVYLFSGLQVTLLCLWLLTGPGLYVWNQMIGGMLLAGGIFCLIVGVILSPFSLLGLMFGIGIFGFTPFLTALVYLRNSRRALRAGHNDAVGFAHAIVPVSAILLASGVPLLLSIQINSAVTRAINEIVEGDSQHAIFAAHRLVPLRFFADAKLDQIVNAYRSESDEKRKELLRSCYREITGDNIENRAPVMPD